MKRTERVGALIGILTDSPNKIYSLQYFCDLFGAAKSSISEDIQSASAAIAFAGFGYLETTTGAKGGVRFVPDISDNEICVLQDEFCKRLSGESVAQRLILRHGRELVAAQHGFDVQSGAATEYGQLASATDVVVCLVEVLLILEQIVLCAWLGYVDKMIRNRLAVNYIVCQVLARSDVHAAVHLARVGTDYLAVGAQCECCRHSGLSACGGSEYGYHSFVLHVVNSFAARVFNNVVSGSESNLFGL